jgi:TetR/AcrR family transcriptional regulator, transcriptional repressor for nem operon
MPRPPGFERDDVLQRATEVFWRRGYGATSVSDLVTATGLKPGSLYAAFGNKKGLFLEVLEQYHCDFLKSVDELLTGAPGPLRAIEMLFRDVAAKTLDDTDARGCLAVNTLLEMAHHDEDVVSNLQNGNERLRTKLKGLLDAAQAEGALNQTADTSQLSAFLLNNLWGMRVLCKSRPTAAALDGIVNGVLSALSAAGADRTHH